MKSPVRICLAPLVLALFVSEELEDRGWIGRKISVISPFYPFSKLHTTFQIRYMGSCHYAVMFRGTSIANSLVCRFFECSWSCEESIVFGIGAKRVKQVI